jgi:hypothetical protein
MLWVPSAEVGGLFEFIGRQIAYFWKDDGSEMFIKALLGEQSILDEWHLSPLQ